MSIPTYVRTTVAAQASRLVGLVTTMGRRLGGMALRRGSWSLIDQAIMSGGTFVGNILMARELSRNDYGIFAILFSAMLGLQIFNTTLLHHPLSIRLVTREDDKKKPLMAASMVLTTALSLMLALGLAIGIVAFGFAYLLVPAIAWFVAWQVQESMRRGLLSLFRHKEACIGDAISYVGQAVAIVALAYFGQLTLYTALWGMALTSLLAALLQLVQLSPFTRKTLPLRETVVDYWSVGGVWTLGSGLFTLVRNQIVPWTLAVIGGPSAAAGFQAAANVISLLNPISMSVGNVMPQAVSEGKAKGRLHAWQTARSYGILALPPIVGYGMLAALVPSVLLMVLYGSDSSYVLLYWPVRFLMLAMFLSYLGEVAIFYLHGMAAIRLAFVINIIAVTASIVLAIPFVSMFGILGGSIAMVASNAIRLIVIYFAMKKFLGEK